MAADPSNPWYGRGIQYVRRWSRDSHRLPSSFLLAMPLDERLFHCYSQTAVSDVYKVPRYDKSVAVKTLRLHSSSREELKKVCLLPA
jgi:hypothetical protein